MSHFRPTPARNVNGLFVVVALGIFDIVLIAMIALDAWRIWGPR